MQWILEVSSKDASHESLRDPGNFLTSDTALTKAAKGELAREVPIFKETEASNSRAVRGSQVLYLFLQYFKTNEEVRSLYSAEDLLKARHLTLPALLPLWLSSKSARIQCSGNQAN